MRFPTRSIATLLMLVGVATCSDTPIAAVKTGTSPTTRFGIGQIALAPVFSKAAQYAAAHLADFPSVRFDSVRVVIRGFPDTAVVVKDTTVFFDTDSDSLALELNVPVQNDGQRFRAGMDYRGPAGVVYHGSQVVQSHRPGQPAPIQPPMVVNYVGAGSKVKSITVAPRALSLAGNQTSALAVTAVDSNNSSIAVPLAFSSSSETIATVSNTGLVQGQSRRGTAIITVRTPSGVTDAASVTVTLPPTAVSVVSGSGQTGKVGTALANPAVVQVSAADGVGVAGVSVIFSAPAGGSASPATATTDANGRASTSMKLGTVAGPQGFAVVAAGFSAGISATATPGDPANVAVVSGGSQADTIHAALAPLIVRVTDSFNNPVSGVAVSWSKSGAGALSAATSTTGADGQASNSYKLGGTLGAESVVASAGTGSASFNFTVTAGSPATIVAVSGGGQSARVGQPMANPFVAKVADVAGNPVRNAAIGWGGENVTINGTAASDASGQASATATGGSSAGAGAVTASIPNGQRVTFPVMILAGAPASATFGPGPSSVIAGQVLPPVRVLLRDATNNPAEGAVTLAIANNPSGAVLEGTLTQSTVSGVATFSDLRITRAGTGYTLRASTAGAVSVTSASFNVTAGAASGLTIVAGNPASATVNTTVATPPSVRLVDAANNPIIGASVTFTPSADGSVTPAGGAVTTNAQGVATLTSWTLGKTAGAQALTASSASGQSVTFTANATPGNANKLALTNKAALQTSVLSGVALSPQPTIQVTDEFGNAVPAGQMQVSIVPTTTAGVTVSASTVALDPATGLGSFTDLKLSGTGSTRLLFLEGSGRIKADTSNTISLSVGPAVSLRLVPATQTSFTFTAGQAVTLPQVKAVDAQENGVPGVTVRAEVDSGTGPGAVVIGANNFVTDASGFISLTQPPATTAGVYRLIATSSGIRDTLTLTATVNPGPAYKVAFANRAALQTTIVSGATLSPQPRVRVVDQYENTISASGANVTLLAASESGITLGGTPTLLLGTSDSASFSGITISGNGSMRLVAASGTLVRDSSSVITVTAPSGGGSAASSIAPSSATSFSGVVGTSLTTLPAVLVKNSAGNPVAGTKIIFTLAAGAGSVNGVVNKPDTVATNSNGIATMSNWTLPTSVGSSYSVTARSAPDSLAGSPITFTASALVGSIAHLDFVGGHDLPPRGFENDANYGNGLRLLARDTYLNPIPGLTIDATTESATSSTSTIRRPGPSADLGFFAQPQRFVTDTTATTDAGGVANFGNVKFRGQAGILRLLFIERGTGRQFRFSSTLRHGAAKNAICSTSLPGLVRPGHRLSASPKLKLTDIDDNIVDSTAVVLAATAGSLSSTTGTTDANGEVSVLTWDVRSSAGEDSVKVNGAGGGCHVRAAKAHRIKLSVTSLARQKNGRLISSIDASVVDSTETELEDEAFSIVAEARPQQGKSININRTKSSNNRGRATFDDLMIDAEEQTGAYLKFSSVVGDAFLRDSLSFDVESGEPEALDRTGADSVHGSVGTLPGGTFKVQVKDHGNRNNLNSATNTVKWTTDAACSSIVTFRLPTSQAINGIASSPEIVIRAGFASGSYPNGCKITADAPGLTTVTFTITP